ncbi:MAG: hypothetical protein ACRDVE_05330 [Actinocrinis sp.]
MATGPEHYTEAESFLDQAQGTSYGDDRETYALHSAQVHATLALAAATAPLSYTSADAEGIAWARAVGTAPPHVRLTWWLDDGQENPGAPELYTTKAVACDAAIKRYERDNPFIDTGGVVVWLPLEEPDGSDGAELAVRGRRTGIFVRLLRPKAEV